MITADSLWQSFRREAGYSGIWLLNTVMRWFVPVMFVAFIMIDGIVTRNDSAWANGPRAGLMICLFGFGMVMLFWYRIKFEPAVAILVGVVAAMIISQSSSNPSRPDLSLWVIAAGTFMWQRAIQHDWRPSLARAGLALSLIVLIVAVLALRGIPAPLQYGAWNQNVVAGTLAVLVPSVISRRNRGKWIVLAAMAVAIIALGSRGGILAAMVAAIVSVRRRRFPRWAAIAVPVILIALVWYSVEFRPIQTGERILFIRGALQQWRQTSVDFGVGPGNLWFMIAGHDTEFVQAHNTIVTIAAMVGIVGGAVIGAALTNMRRVVVDDWQLATLSALMVHGLVDDPFTWLPTVIIAAIAAAGVEFENRMAVAPH